MITKEQVRAARAFLGWKQERLAKESGVSLAQIASFEQGQIENPRQRTLEDIERALLRAGVAFKDGGVIPRTDCTTRIEGEGWYLKLLDDVYQTLVDRTDPEAIILYGDESRSPSDVIQRWKKIRNLGTKVRRIVRAGDTHLLGPLHEYRYMPEGFFNNNVIIIYANKVAICAVNNTMALVIEDAPLAQTFRLRTDYDFTALATPTKSTAHERI